ncbi:MAG TPA: lysylphosphatidylglycerol synthase domain-containing protein [Acetobacteraceae bacterium]
MIQISRRAGWPRKSGIAVVSLRKVKSLSLAFTILGLLLGTLLIGWFGAARIGETLMAVGWRGLMLVCAWQMAMFVVLGAAWATIVPGRQLAIRCFVWGRMVRDAGGNCLPFSRLGGFALGVRAIVLAGLGWAAATATTILDTTNEFLAQILFMAVALAILLAYVPNWPLATPLAIALVAALVAGVSFVALQRRTGDALFGRLLDQISRRFFRNDTERLIVVQRELSRAARNSGRLLRAIGLHLTGWIATGVAGWIGFHLVGVPIGLLPALAIEGLLHGVLALSFLVPGALGVQEAAYIGLAAIFGVPAEAALSVSLLRRARDLALGIPILLCWQFVELRRLRGRRSDAPGLP